MMRRLLYIMFILLPVGLHATPVNAVNPTLTQQIQIPSFNRDSTRLKRVQQNRMDLLSTHDNGIKEVPNAKRQPKPEKISKDTTNNKGARSKRRPDNVERPPDIIRRNN